MDWQKSIVDIDAEILALQKVRASMLEASGGEPARNSRVGTAGSKVISLSASLRWLKQKGGKPAEIKALEEELKQAKAVLEADKAARKARIKAVR
jgi:hypothetical protein